MAYQTILLDIADDVATVTLNRPDKLNAFSVEMHEELRAAIKEIKAAKARAMPSPIPDAPPVTNAPLPFKSSMNSKSQNLKRRCFKLAKGR